MRLPHAILYLLTLFTLSHALALPSSLHDLTEASRQLFKRRGGGRGGGGGGGGSSGGRPSGGGGGGGSRPSGGGGGIPSSPPRTSPNSNLGGSTAAGSGTPRGYGGGGGAYYGGGASVPYRPNTPRSGLGTPLLIGAGAGALLFFPGLARYGAYSYAYPYNWTYRNNTSGRNESYPAECWCARYTPCSCEENRDLDYMQAVANNVSIARLVRLPDERGNETLVVDGSMANGTTAPGGSDDAMGAAVGRAGEVLGFWPVVVVAVATVYGL